MDLEVRGSNLIARLSGDLDVMSAETFRRQVDMALGRHRARNLYVDLTDVTFVDSSGLGAILGRYKRMRQGGGRMILVNPPPAIRPVLELAGLFRLMEVIEEGNSVPASGAAPAAPRREG